MVSTAASNDAPLILPFYFFENQFSNWELSIKNVGGLKLWTYITGHLIFHFCCVEIQYSYNNSDNFLWLFAGMNLIKELVFTWLILNSSKKLMQPDKEKAR